MIRALFLDLDGTLIDRAGLWRRCLSGFLSGRGLELRDDPAVAEALRSPFTDRPRMARILGASAAGLGLDLDRAEIGRALRDQMLRASAPDPEVIAVVDALALRYRTAIVTNGSEAVQRSKIAGSGLAGRVGSVFISGRMGVRKPDPAFFARVLAWSGVEPEEALIVGDHPNDDIFGGQRAGLQTCAVGERYDGSWPQPDYRIARFADLPGVLG